MKEREFIAGDAGYGPLTSADERRLSAFASPPQRPGFWCRLGFHRWRVEDQSRADGDYLNVLRCARCRKRRSSIASSDHQATPGEPGKGERP